MRQSAGIQTTALLIALAILVGLAGCEYDRDKPIFMAPGAYGDVAIVVSDASMVAGLEPFRAAFNDEHTFVIATEKRFSIDVYSPDRWDLCQGYKNIIFVWRVGDGGPVSKELRRQLSDAGEERVARGGGTTIQIDEPYGSYQIAVVVAGTDRNSLMSYLRAEAFALRDRFERESSRRIMSRYRHEGLATELMSDLWIRHRFFLEIPGDFRLNQEAPDGYPGVELIQNSPSRGITVAWTQSVDPEFLVAQKALLVELRREMGLKIHHEDIVPESLVWREDRLGDLDVWRLEGAWNSRTFDGGGPFWSWFVADPENQRVLCIDILCYAPGMAKMDIFRRMRTVAQTFTLERPQR